MDCPMTRKMAYVLMLATVMVAILPRPQAALADVYVLESTTMTINAGSRLAASDTITIPKDSFIRAVLPSGKTQTIKGPYNGSVADLDKGQPHNDGVLSWIRNILETGGSKEVTPGATRSIRREPAAVNMAFSWSNVPVTADAVVCVARNGKVQLLRAPSPRAERVTIVDTLSGARGEAQWEAGGDVAAWPVNLTPRADTTYYLLVPDRPQRQVRFRILEQLPADDDVLVVLQGEGCRSQFNAWVRERLASASKR
jgi:hypothetical protein